MTFSVFLKKIFGLLLRRDLIFSILQGLFLYILILYMLYILSFKGFFCIF